MSADQNSGLRDIDCDVEAIARARRGDQVAYRELFDRYRDSVFAFLGRYRDLSRDDVVDLLQQSFVHAFRHLDQLANPRLFRAWLTIIARNLAISALRARGGEAVLLARYQTEVASTEASKGAVWASTDDPYYREQLLSAVEELVSTEPNLTTRAIAALYYGEERVTTAQIGERLGLPKGTVTVALMRFRNRASRQLVRRLLAHENPSLVDAAAALVAKGRSPHA